MTSKKKKPAVVKKKVAKKSKPKKIQPIEIPVEINEQPKRNCWLVRLLSFFGFQRS